MDLELPFQIGPYDLVEELGVGGFATVYRGVLRGSMGFTRDFAVKLLAPEVAQASPEMVSLLADEARVLSRIRHRSVVSAQWFGAIEHEDHGPIYVLVMEYVPGTTLHSLLALDDHEHGVPERPVVLEILLHLAEALDAAHSLLGSDDQPMGLVHRDVKPGNVMVTPQGEVVLLDFGIAKARDRIADATRSDRIRGTIGYLAPEQIEGTDIDFRADHFALGALLYQMVTGERILGDGPVLQQLKQIATFDPTEYLARLRFEFPEIEGIASKLLARHPDDRYEATCLLVDDIRQVIDEVCDDEALPGWAARHVPPARAMARDFQALESAPSRAPQRTEPATPSPAEPPPEAPPEPEPLLDKGLPGPVLLAIGLAAGTAVGYVLG